MIGAVTGQQSVFPLLSGLCQGAKVVLALHVTNLVMSPAMHNVP